MVRKRLADLLLLGDPRLYERCDPVFKSEQHLMPGWVTDLHCVMEEVREKHGFGRGIAAPQLGIMKRLFYLNIDQPVVVVNPVLTFNSEEKFSLWDDCMSLPNLLVKLKRHKNLTITFLDEIWQEQVWKVEDKNIAELIQHEYDHLDGILCTMRAIDDKSFKWRTNH